MGKFIIPAGGEATRLLPLTDGVSKSMIPVAGRPCIEWLLDGKNDADIIVITGKESDLPKYLNLTHPSITCINQLKPTGPVDAIKLGLNIIADSCDSITVWLGDTIVTKQIDILPNSFVTSKVDNPVEWCVCYGEKFYNKSDRSDIGNNALIGIYTWNDVGILRKMIKNATEISDLLEGCSEIKIDNSIWMDIGQLSTYAKSNATLIASKARSFNKIVLNIHDNSLIKYSNNLQGEQHWYKALTPIQQRFVPPIYDIDENYIEMGIVDGQTLTDTLLLKKLPQVTWEWIIHRIISTMEDYFWQKCEPFDTSEMWVGKTRVRINALKNVSDIRRIMRVAEAILPHSICSNMIHGDLHTDNILFNFATGGIKLIDPRGEWGKYGYTTKGDILYDLGKLSHDFTFGYTSLVAGIPINEIAKAAFEKVIIDRGYNYEAVTKCGYVLLASCIACHSDRPDRQERMIKRIA